MSFNVTFVNNASNATDATNPLDPYIDDKFLENYDYCGALVYIVVIILFYALSGYGIIFLLTKKRTDFLGYENEDQYNHYRPEAFLKHMKSENITKEALEDLRNPEIRNKLWTMYDQLIIDKKSKQPPVRVENKKLNQIDKKLKQLHKNEASNYKTIDGSLRGEYRPPLFRQHSNSKLEGSRIRFHVSSVSETSN